MNFLRGTFTSFVMGTGAVIIILGQVASYIPPNGLEVGVSVASSVIGSFLILGACYSYMNWPLDTKRKGAICLGSIFILPILVIIVIGLFIYASVQSGISSKELQQSFGPLTQITPTAAWLSLSLIAFSLGMIAVVELGPKPFAQLWQSISHYHAKKRPAIGWAIIVLFCIIFLFGIVWNVFYNGVLVPMYTNVSGQYGSSIFDANTLTFVQTFIAWWPFTLTLAVLYWLWQQSNKRDLQYA